MPGPGAAAHEGIFSGHCQSAVTGWGGEASLPANRAAVSPRARSSPWISLSTSLCGPHPPVHSISFFPSEESQASRARCHSPTGGPLLPQKVKNTSNSNTFFSGRNPKITSPALPQPFAAFTVKGLSSCLSFVFLSLRIKDRCSPCSSFMQNTDKPS